jgi:hypothetical protein
MSLGRAGIYTKPLEFSGFNGIARAPLGYALQCLRLSYATKRPTRPTGDALSNHSSILSHAWEGKGGLCSLRSLFSL